MNGETILNDTAVLTCWKDIAQYMGKGVRTVQRWEQEFGLPVRRPDGTDHKTAVIARIDDLEAWLKARWTLRRANEPEYLDTYRTPGDQETLVDLRQRIQTSRALRKQHGNLMIEISVALQTLVQNCDRLAKDSPSVE